MSKETELGYVKRGGPQSARYWILNPATSTRPLEVGTRRATGMVNRESAKSQILDILRTRATHGQPPLANADVREISLVDRQQVSRLAHELVDDGDLRIEGRGKRGEIQVRWTTGGPRAGTINVSRMPSI